MSMCMKVSFTLNNPQRNIIEFDIKLTRNINYQVVSLRAIYLL